MSQLAESILTAARARPEGGLLAAKEFLHLGTRAAVDQTLSRLARSGALIRVGRGLYAAPVVTRFGPRVPSTESVIEAIEQTTGEVIVPSGAAEANALGLTTQVPTREVFLTSGRPRRLRLGKRTIYLERGTPWQLRYHRTPAGQAIRALVWSGPENANVHFAKLREILTLSDWEKVEGSKKIAPDWAARALATGRPSN
ncbi:MAG: DUF6088 family protein [Gemmatimonadota bacterium]|nr:DUF6088 family protein [Gemmatimonadota bacterium]MDQ8178221.1 DUF6088 family protein [Gemmatimonadota bacterium]